MEAGTWGGFIGVALLLLFLFTYRYGVKKFFRSRREKKLVSKAEEIVENTKDSQADAMLQSMYSTVKSNLPRKVEEGIEWREQNLTPEFFEYVYYVDKSKHYVPDDFVKIKKSMISKKGKIKTIAELCEKSGRSVAFKYVCERDNTEHRIIIKSSDFSKH